MMGKLLPIVSLGLLLGVYFLETQLVEGLKLDPVELAKHMSPDCRTYLKSPEGKEKMKSLKGSHEKYMKMLQEKCPGAHTWIQQKISEEEEKQRRKFEN
ncbi:unnamed protein product [Allacma fusca]|uniref:Uncharacterized protein n=1 Tax=Allacma fusca TaxID=39272 RepID=A0A8J2PGN1_9HEXA|nr:unnamed protein product [Allacma fusca]